MTALTDFLLARIAEDEAAARAVLPLDYSVDMGGHRNDERWYVVRLRFSSADGAARSEQDEQATALFARHDPAHVLAVCAAHRRIVEEHRAEPTAATWQNCTTCAGWASGDEPPPIDWPCPTLRALASVYADHPDYREEWKP